MKAKELAAVFDMSVKELAQETGYSRRAIYKIIDESESANRTRYTAMIKQLALRAKNERDKDIGVIQEKYQKRLKALEKIYNELP